MVPKGILVVGHGTRDRRGIDEFHQTVTRLAEELPEAIVRHCFLELAQPTIADGLAELLSEDIDEVTILPLILFQAGHAKRDIPSAVHDALRRISTSRKLLPNVLFALPLGCQENLLKLSEFRYSEALSRQDEATGEQANRVNRILIMIGRGSPDNDATAEMHRFLDLRTKMTAVDEQHLCFLAMASPSLEGISREIVAKPGAHVVVQPHLLFQGTLMDQVNTWFEQVSGQCRHHRWTLTKYLGPHPLLVAAMQNRSMGRYCQKFDFEIGLL